jgi:hypothetical protein
MDIQRAIRQEVAAAVASATGGLFIELYIWNFKFILEMHLSSNYSYPLLRNASIILTTVTHYFLTYFCAFFI